jgi:hypothetical protein
MMPCVVVDKLMATPHMLAGAGYDCVPPAWVTSSELFSSATQNMIFSV